MLTRNEQTSANEQTTAPWSISETNDHNNMKTNIIADRWLVFTVCYKTSPLKVKASAIMHVLCLCYAPKTMTIFFVGNTCSERQNALINNSPFSFAVFCLHILCRSRSQQLQEAFIMSLATRGKSQYSKNKNGFETWGAFKYCTIGPNTTEMSS